MVKSSHFRCTVLGVILAILVCTGGRCLGQDDNGLDDWIRSAQDWAKENLDQDALRVLQSGDRQHIEKLFSDIQGELHGEYVLDLPTLLQTARTLLPLLERYEETLPYALWLRSRLDYLEVAEELKRKARAVPVPPGEKAKTPPNPSAPAEREIWVHKVAQRPSPKTSKDYVARLKPIFAEERVAPELVWIAEVESSFDPRARSPVGAAGLFQLMPATAKRFGLRTWPLDQRLDPEDSARASAKYLGFLHNHFKDWRLALAAYNAGEGTVQKLLKQKKATTFDSISTRLPAETQMFVPRVEATILRREGRALTGLR